MLEQSAASGCTIVRLLFAAQDQVSSQINQHVGCVVNKLALDRFITCFRFLRQETRGKRTSTSFFICNPPLNTDSMIRF